ncbi:MAG TPA: transposase, partial [Nitrospirota bacterium]|nr:transposase [Nitrospirota bacterium]
MVIRKAFKYRLRLSKPADAVPLYQYAGSGRFVWNKALSLQIERLEKKKRLLSYPEMAKKLLRWKKQYPFLKEVPSQALQQRLMDLDKAIWEGLEPKNPKQFPKFKKKYKSVESFRYPQGFEIKKNRIFLPKFGWMRFFKSREMTGIPKNVTVSLTGKHWYVSVQTETEAEKPVHPSDSAVGGDFGTKRLLTLSNGFSFFAVNALQSYKLKLAAAQRKLARQVKKSSNWKKQKQKIQRIHLKIASIRRDWQHKVSSHL